MRVRLVRVVACALGLALSAGCGAGSTATKGGARTASVESRAQVDGELADIRLLAVALAAQHICERVRGQLIPVGGEGDEPAEGRMWVRDCSSRMEQEHLALTVSAILWTWVNEGSSAVGADFEVAQHVGMEAEVELAVIPHVRYDREAQKAFVWLEPVRDPTVSVETIGVVDAEAQSLWAEFVAFAAGVFGPSENERAADRVEEQADQRLEERVDQGLTFAMDMCTSHTATELGRVEDVPASEAPDRAAPNEPTTIRLRPRGFDAAGPFRSGEVTVEVTDGVPVHARLVCADDAARMIRAYVHGGLDTMPEVQPVAEARVEPASSVTLRPEEATDCDLVLVSRLSEGEGISRMSYQEALPEPVPLVSGCSEDEPQRRAER